MERWVINDPFSSYFAYHLFKTNKMKSNTNRLNKTTISTQYKSTNEITQAKQQFNTKNNNTHQKHTIKTQQRDTLNIPEIVKAVKHMFNEQRQHIS